MASTPFASKEPLVEVLGTFYPVAHREGAVKVDKLTIVKAPLKAYKVDSLATIPAYKAFLIEELKCGRLTLDHIAVLHGAMYEPNPNQFVVSRCFGVVFDADDAGADDARILRIFRYALDRHTDRFASICVEKATAEDGRTVEFLPRPKYNELLPHTLPVTSTLSTSIKALKATKPIPEPVYPSLPTQAETLEWLAQTRGDEDEVGRAAFLRRTLDHVAEMRHTRFGGVDLFPSELDLPQSIFAPEDNDEVDEEIVGVFQRLGFPILRFTPPMGCRFSLALPGFARTGRHQLEDWETDVLTDAYHEGANCFNYFYPRTFRRVRQIGVLRCIPRLLGWLRSARIKLADPARPGVLDTENKTVDEAMQAAVWTKGALGKRARGE